jgi:hypothetical protein
MTQRWPAEIAGHLLYPDLLPVVSGIQAISLRNGVNDQLLTDMAMTALIRWL